VHGSLLTARIITSIDRILAQLFKWAQPQIDACPMRADRVVIDESPR
jgi:hypothetical protein